MKTLTAKEYSRLWWETEAQGSKTICPTCRGGTESRVIDEDKYSKTVVNCPTCDGEGWVIRKFDQVYRDAAK